MRVIQKALTFDDVLLLPAHSRVLPREVSLKTRLTDRKSTRLNSSHLVISYAVFCLKKKKTTVLQFKTLSSCVNAVLTLPIGFCFLPLAAYAGCHPPWAVQPSPIHLTSMSSAALRPF